MNDVSFTIAQDLNLDVTSPRHESFDVHAGITKCGGCLSCCEAHCVREILQPIDTLHSATAASTDCLDQQWRADLPAKDHGLADRLYWSAGSDRHIRSFCLFPCSQFIAYRLDLRGRGPDENHSLLFAKSGESRTLREETVAGMNGVCSHTQCCLHNRVNSQVAVGSTGRTNANGAVCETSG